MKLVFWCDDESTVARALVGRVDDEEFICRFHAWIPGQDVVPSSASRSVGSEGSDTLLAIDELLTAF